MDYSKIEKNTNLNNKKNRAHIVKYISTQAHFYYVYSTWERLASIFFDRGFFSQSNRRFNVNMQR